MNWHDSARYFCFNSFLPMHVQGNQNPVLCLEKKQTCIGIEQR
jgi:hypothetical protein